MVELVIGLAIGACAGMAWGWYMGYRTGQDDAACASTHYWPWNDMEHWEG